MKKWEQLQLTLDNSKSKEGPGNYQGKIQNLFKTMRGQIIEFTAFAEKELVG